MPQPPQDLLQRITAKAVAARDQAALVKDLEERLAAAKNTLTYITNVDLPDLLDEAGTDTIGLPASGNLPAIDITMHTVHRANIAAGWPEERRSAAFAWLDANGHGDLIKTAVTISWPRELRDKAREFMELFARRYGTEIKPEIKEMVHPGTMTAWFKHQVRNGGALPPLDVIGASSMRVAEMKESQED